MRIKHSSSVLYYESNASKITGEITKEMKRNEGKERYHFTYVVR